MTEYHKIDSVFKRDPATKYKTLLFGEYSQPEFEYLASNPWVFTEKVDGTNIRIFYEDGEVQFRGKTDKAQTPQFLLDKLATRVTAQDFVENFPYPEEVCLYGEGYGKRIQKGGKYIKDDVDFMLFDIRIGHWWLQRDDVHTLASNLELVAAPVIGRGTLTDLVLMVREGFKSVWGDFTAEGIVARPKVELYARSGRRIITKLKHKDFQEVTDGTIR